MITLLRQLVIICVIAMAFLASCVERYHPDDMYLKSGLLVISAHITDKPGTQTIEVSRSSHPEAPTYNAETGCFILLFREDGESREFTASEVPGYYTAELDSSFLQAGVLFQVQVVTQDGNEYHSDFDKIRPVPAYEYIRWELTETYEFHNPTMDAWVYPNRWTRLPLEGEDNPRICYITRTIPTSHTLAANELENGTYSKPFDFVPDDWTEQKLAFKYSLLVKQYSLGPEGFQYWNETGSTRQGQGMLFDKQPALIKSNIHNIVDESEKVLGYFTMSAVQEIRGSAEDIPELDQETNPYYCLPVDSGPGSNRPTYFPSYFAQATYDGETVYARVNHHCVDCREYDGSSAIKPDYW
jgi:hypothetical protein